MATFLTLKEKILSFLDEMGIRKVDFFESTGIQSSNFKGVNIKSAPGGDMLVKILTSYPSLSAEWLMRGDGEMLRDKPSHNTAKEPTVKETTTIESNFVGGMGEVLDRFIGTIKDQAEEIGRLQERIRQYESEKNTSIPAPRHSQIIMEATSVD